MENQKILDNFQSDKQNLNKKPVYLIIGVSLLVLVIIIVSFFLFSKTKEKNNLNQQTISPTLAIQPGEKTTPSTNKLTKGEISFKTIEKNFEVNKLFPFVIKVDSGKEQVVGIDVLIKFDKNKLKLLKAKSLLKEFDLYQSVVDDYLNLTLTKSLKAKEPIFLSQSDFIELQFMPLSKGNAFLDIAPKYQKRRTFFVNEKSEMLFPRLPEKLLININ